MKKQSLGKLCNQKPIFEIAGFELRPFDDESYFLENPIGEGTQISKIKFESYLYKIFNETF